jgi:hypothetical protein
MKIFPAQPSASDVPWIDSEARKATDLKTECTSAIPDRIQGNDNQQYHSSPFMGLFCYL